MIKKKFFFHILFFTTIIFIGSCDKFKRFGQEKYFCAKNKLSINQIDIIKTNSIKKAYMIIGRQEIPLEIKSINKNEISLFSNVFTIRINKNNNEVSVSDENKIHFLKCKSETFNM